MKVARRALSRHVKDKMETHLNLACVMVQEHRQEIQRLKQQIKPRLIWKMDHFAQRRELAEKTAKQKYCFSPSFSTGPQGYQKRMLVCSNGIGQGENTHLSVFAVIVKGEDDAILPWPFNLGVTLTLIDQQENPTEQQNISGKPTYFPQGAFTRPVQQNKQFGIQEFVSHETLKTRRYVLDNALFFQLEVD